MKSKNIYIYLILFGLIYSSSLGAKDIYDVFSNKMLSTRLQSKDVESKFLNYKNEVDVTYFQVSKTNESALIKLNLLSFDLCADYLKVENKAMSINREVNQRIEIYNELQNSSAQDHYSRANSSIQNPPKLSDIESDLISMVGNKLFIEISFQFEIPGNRYNGNQEFELKHYYVYDVNTESIKRWENKLSSSQLNKVQKLISNQLNQDYLIATSKLKQSELDLIDEGDEAQESEAVCKDICTRIDLKDADLYWYAWGVMVQFQEFTPSSSAYYGKAFRAFIPFEEAKILFSTIPQFSFINGISSPSNDFKNFNLQEFQKQIFKFRGPYNVEDVVAFNPSSSVPKTLTTTRKQLFKNDRESFQNKSVTEYNMQRMVISRTTYHENGSIYNSEFYTYDSEGYLAEYLRKDRSKEEDSKVYYYDANGNLVQVSRISKHNNDKQLYFYNGHHIYTITINTLGSNGRETINQYALIDNKYINKGSTYLLDDENKCIASIAEKYVSNQIQVGWDSLGRFVESHHDNDRYHYYCKYDDLGRLSQFSHYEYQKPRKIIEYSYRDDSSLPYRRMSTQYSGGQIIWLSEDYEWAFFK